MPGRNRLHLQCLLGQTLLNFSTIQACLNPSGAYPRIHSATAVYVACSTSWINAYVAPGFGLQRPPPFPLDYFNGEPAVYIAGVF